MNVRFPRYTASFSCPYTVQEAWQRLSDAVSCNHNNLTLIERQPIHTSFEKIVISANTGSNIYHNSFLPIVSIEIKELRGSTHISFFFELKKSVKALLVLFFSLALLFEITLLFLWITNQLSSFTLQCLPLGMLIFSYGLSNIGLFLSSKGVLRILFTALTLEDTTHMPSIHSANRLTTLA